jgi:flavin-dependent dehydrogenase
MTFDTLSPQVEGNSGRLELQDGSQVAIIGGGPAGSFFSFYLLDMAERIGLDIEVDVYEPRDFFSPGPGGCNMCGGIISESLVQTLASDGINLPPTVIQRGLDSYILHTDVGSVRIETPLQEKRIGAVHRGSGPRDIKEIKWISFDGHLQSLTVEKGARINQERVTEIKWIDGRPQVKTRSGSSKTYDLVVAAIGVNTSARKLFQDLDFDYHSPKTTKTFIREYFMGSERIEKTLGDSMHVFLLNIPRLEFAAIIPKGDYVTACMLGEDIDDILVHSFLNSPVVKACMPSDWQVDIRSCQCSPRINIQGASRPYGDRIVFIGDCGVTRLYKDGIGAAYRTAKAAASTAIFQGISAQDFERSFWPACKTINTDNTIGKVSFIFTEQIQKRRFARRALVQMTRSEQEKPSQNRHMSTVMWDMFTGSAPYREIFMRTLKPAFILSFLGHLVASLQPSRKQKVL